jgi:hypothetical protein
MALSAGNPEWPPDVVVGTGRLRYSHSSTLMSRWPDADVSRERISCVLLIRSSPVIASDRPLLVKLRAGDPLPIRY